MSSTFFARILPLKPLSPGYRVPDLMEPFMSTFVRIGEGLATTPEGEKIYVPQQISLRCRLVPKPFTAPHAQAQVVLDGVSLKPIFLYQENSLNDLEERGYHLEGLIAKVSLEYTGQGSFHFKTHSTPIPVSHHHTFQVNLTSGQMLFEKFFGVQTAPLIQQHFERTEDGTWKLSPSGQADIIPLRAYAGFYTPGASFAQIEQLFFHCGQRGQSTELHITNSSEWSSAGVYYPGGGVYQGQKIIFMEPNLGLTNLSQDLEGGGSIINLLVHENSHLMLPYHSVSYRMIGEGVADIIYQPSGRALSTGTTRPKI